MNRSKKSLPKQQLKTMRKEVRLSQGKQPETSSLKITHATPKRGKGAAKKNTRRAMQKNISLKQLLQEKKGTAKLSKRTTPGMVEESVPQSIHVEGQRWMKTLVKQNVLKGKLLSKRMQKR